METKPRWTKWVEQPNAEQQAVLDALATLGDERAELTHRKAYTSTSGRLRLDEIYAELRKLIEDGVKVRLGHEQMRERLGVASSAYYRIKGGRTGTGR